MMERFDKLHKNMMEGFFKGKLPSLSDSPFNDPFFKDSGFGRMDKMFEEAKSMMAGMDSMPVGGGKGRYMKQSYVSSQTMKDGRPHRETY